MLKNISEIKGAQELTEKEQKAIKGGQPNWEVCCPEDGIAYPDCRYVECQVQFSIYHTLTSSSEFSFCLAI